MKSLNQRSTAVNLNLSKTLLQIAATNQHMALAAPTQTQIISLVVPL